MSEPLPARHSDGDNPVQRLNAFGRIGLAVQQRLEIDPGELRQHMRQTNEAAEHAVAIEAVGEIGMPRTADGVALVTAFARADWSFITKLYSRNFLNVHPRRPVTSG